MLYYIGLSNFSSTKKVLKPTTQRKDLSAEARRVLSLLYENPINENDFLAEAGGRPFLRVDNSANTAPVDFNVSHSGEIAAVSFVKGEGLRTGCDIERVRFRKGSAKIAEDYFSVDEKKYIINDGEFDTTKFFEVWTLKESYLKLRGFSVFDMVSVPSFITYDDSQKASFTFCESVSVPLSFRLYELTDNSASVCQNDRYMLAAVIEGTVQKLPEIRWFSQSVLDCKMRAEINAAPSPAQTVSPKR